MSPHYPATLNPSSARGPPAVFRLLTPRVLDSVLVDESLGDGVIQRRSDAADGGGLGGIRPSLRLQVIVDVMHPQVRNLHLFTNICLEPFQVFARHLVAL